MLEYSDFYDIAIYANEHWNGSFTTKEIAENAKAELNTLWNEVKRMKNPHKYYVDLSQELWNLKDSMLHNL